MTPYDLWLYFLQTFLNTIKFFKDHPTVPGLIILIMRQNSIRKVINSRLPKQFRDTVDADILEIKQDIKEIKREMGIEACSNLQLNGLKTTPIPLFRRFILFLHKVIPQGSPLRRKTKMREYLKKLGRTKLQVYIVFSIVNIYTLFSTLSGHTSISTELDPYMPAINIFAQVVGNWIYTHYQGKVDVVTAQNSAPVQSDPNQFIQG